LSVLDSSLTERAMKFSDAAFNCVSSPLSFSSLIRRTASTQTQFDIQCFWLELDLLGHDPTTRAQPCITKYLKENCLCPIVRVVAEKLMNATSRSLFAEDAANQIAG
jgi:hypothetical protein